MIFAKCYLLILGLVCGAYSYKILVYYPTPSYSHQRAILALTERLVKDGHELFVISPNAVPVSNFSLINTYPLNVLGIFFNDDLASIMAFN